MSEIKTVGIVGAGKLGVTIAQLALAAGYQVSIAGSGDPAKIALATKIITPGAIAATTEDAVQRADVTILALPLSKFRTLDASLFADKLVIDSMNHWYEIDGPLEAIVSPDKATSEAVQEHLDGAVVIKALNHMGYHHLRDETRPKGAPGRKAIAVAGDDEASVHSVMDFVDSLGFSPLPIGALSESRVLESGGEAFGTNLSYDDLHALVTASETRATSA